MPKYEIGTDAQGNARYALRPKSMTEEEFRELVEWALDPPYGVVTPITVAELRQLAKARGMT